MPFVVFALERYIRQPIKQMLFHKFLVLIYNAVRKFDRWRVSEREREGGREFRQRIEKMHFDIAITYGK